MRTIIIRDDDTSFFTRPDQLERIYGKLWEHNIPVALAVIPAQSGDTRVRHRSGAPYDPSIPPAYRGKSKNYPINENKILCEFLNEKVAHGLVQICQHGYEHTYMEFKNNNGVEIETAIQRGQKIFEQVFSNMIPKIFIAPYDHISHIAMKHVLENEFHLCTATHNLAFTPFAAMTTYQQRSINEKQSLFTCDEYIFNHRDDPEQCLQTALSRLDDPQVEVFIIANHYWTFFYDWAGENTALLSAWDRFVEVLLGRDDLQFVMFAAR